MKNIKSFLVFLGIAFFAISLNAQSFDYSSAWRAVDSLAKKQYYSQAYDRADDLYKQALKEKNSRNILVGVSYLYEIGSTFKEDVLDNALARLRFVAPLLDNEDRAIVHILTASIYSDYYYDNRFIIEERFSTGQDDMEMAFWDIVRIRKEVEKEIRLAFSDIAKLKHTPAISLKPLVKEVVVGNDGDLTPTLFDVMVDKAVSIYDVMGFAKLKSQDLTTYKDAFSYDRNFVGVRVKVTDTARSMSAFLFSLLQQREQLHMERRSSDRVMIKLYLDRVNALGTILINDDGEKDVVAQLPSVIAHFRNGNDKMITDLYYKLMNDYYSLFNSDSLVAAVKIADTAYALHPKSPGAIECFNLKQRIEQPRLNVKVRDVVTSQRHISAYLEEANVDTVFFRVINSVEKKNNYDQKAWIKQLLKQKVIAQWDMYLADKGDYRSRKVFFAIPPLPQGDYMLLASSSRAFDTMVITSLFSVEDAVFFFTDDYRGFIVDRKTGEPVANKEVQLQMKKNYNGVFQTKASVKTDKDGHFDFTDYKYLFGSNHYSCRYIIDYNGRKTFEYKYIESGSYNGDNNNLSIFFDRPVYKPGDTVRFSLVDYYYDYDRMASVAADQKIECLLMDVNDKVIDTLTLITDEFGTIDGLFVIPDDALPGEWNVKYYKSEQDYGYSWFVVEAYKQPKFTVTLSKPAEERSFLVPARVEGVAASYSAVPISGAKVSYTVTRSMEIPYWRWNWWSIKPSEVSVVAKGEVTTDEKGFFSIQFVPTPDSNADLSLKPTFRYEVDAKVTDVNGETHEASTTLCVGMQSLYVYYGDINQNIIPVGLKNIDGNVIDGNIDITLQRLKCADKPLLEDDGFPLSGMEIPFSKSQMEKMFPLYNYDTATMGYENWPMAKQYPVVHATTSSQKPYYINKDSYPAGVYRLTATTYDKGDTLTTTAYFVNQPKNTSEPFFDDLIHVEVDTTECEVGGKVHLRVGSRFEKVTFYVMLHKNGKYYRYERHSVSNGFKDIYIPVNDTLLGGFVVEVAAMKENSYESQEFNISVPYTEKKLDVVFTTFRDKLEPGTYETWTLEVKDAKTGNTPAANLLMTMYDASLDNYGGLYYSLNLWRQSFSSNYFSFYNPLHGSNRYYLIQPKPLNFDYQYKLNVLSLVENTYNTYNNRYVMRAARLAKSYIQNAETARGMEMNEEIEAEYEPGEPEVFTMLEVVDDELNVEEVVIAADETKEVGSKGDKENINIRQNMNTLAFFRPTLRTSKDGSVSLTFKVPDLLTEWNIKGLAWTKDLKIGSVNKTAVTQKRLMVVPNVPRFLRHGDTCLFSVKVSNMDDKEQNVAVTLRMSNGANGDLLPMIVGDTVKSIELKAGASGEVVFKLAAPRAAVFVANYLVVARGQGVADGEQAAIPLLPSRQLVTESMAFYINGAGDKSFELKHLSQLDTSAPGFSLVNHALMVDMTPNPVWMAIQSLPYVQRHNNPSNIYLANSIYTNSLSFAIVNNNPQIETMFREWEKNGGEELKSQLRLNADIKQTVVEETPWLQDAIAEEQRHRDIARFFDNKSLAGQIEKDITKLLADQRADGGWCWIPGGSYSSLYTTQYILKSFGLLQSQGVKLDNKTLRALNKAMDFVDAETYKYYKKYVKNKGYDVVNLDYLYLRSYYPGNKMSKNQKEAYDFFYNNAKKYNESYRSLYTQAMLSVVFNRAGDKRLAREMAVRIKEKALYNDEMGMYWRDNVGGCSWSERPIETQAMLIRTMSEVLGDSESVCRMQQWILKQKQTTNWNTDVSTVNAIQALLVDGGSDTLAPVRIEPSLMTVSYGSHTLSSDTSRHQIHISQRHEGAEITPGDGKLTVKKADKGIAWGAMYWQYFENVEKIPASSMGVTLKRSLYRINNDGTLTTINDGKGLAVGDKVRVRIEIDASRNLEYLELKDPRSASMEPVDTRSGWHWNGGLSYYCAVTNAAQTLYIDRLNKGKYVVEYDMFVNNAGTYVAAPTTIQSVYAPEFRALCPSEKLFVAPRR